MTRPVQFVPTPGVRCSDLGFCKIGVSTKGVPTLVRIRDYVLLRTLDIVTTHGRLSLTVLEETNSNKYKSMDLLTPTLCLEEEKCSEPLGSKGPDILT